MLDRIIELAEKYGIGKAGIRNAGMVLVCLFLLCVVIVVYESGSGEIVTEIERPAFGEADQIANLVASVDGETCEVSTAVKSRALSAEEEEKLFAKAREEMEKKLLGQNENSSRIIHPLNINAKCSFSEVDAYFQITDYDLIRYDGTILYPENFENDTHTVVKLILKIGEEERIYDVDLYLYKPVADEISNDELIKEEIGKANEDRESEVLVLPNRIGEKEVTFSKRKSSILAGVIVLGFVATALCLYIPYKKKKDEGINRKEELEIGYCELTSKLSVFVGAGLSVKSALEKMLSDYKSEVGKQEVALYEEINALLVSIEGGLLEDEALMKFAEKIGIASYQKLVSQIISNRKNGATKLRDFLRQEAEDAFEKRLTIAKRKGEKISSKLLIPMIILFALILIILIIPAFLSW